MLNNLYQNKNNCVNLWVKVVISVKECQTLQYVKLNSLHTNTLHKNEYQ